MRPRLFRKLSYVLLTGLFFIFSYEAFKVAHDQYKNTAALPGNEKLALFDPHRPEFTCVIEATKVPPIDAQADAWFLEARTLEDPNLTWEEDRDYKKIVQLTRQAAERRHWKAMLNLATLYLEKRDPQHGVPDALALVEEAMRLGIPAAYDRMGTYYMNGIGVQGDATKAFAFWQRAADMGDPRAMTYLGEKMASTWDRPNEGYWANIPVATKMLECALRQGYGKAAYQLYYFQAWPRTSDGKSDEPRNAASKALGLRTLHEGVKLGCSKCARDLSVEFDNPDDLADMLVPHLDKARSKRYAVFNDALDFNPALLLPNLDKVLPLPPAPLPPWNGDKAALINAAKAVVTRPTPPKQTAASQRSGRYALDAAYDFRPSDDRTDAAAAPFGGYWQPTAPHQPEQVRAYVASIPPGLYRPGEPFERLRFPDGNGQGQISGVIWQRMLTVPHDQAAVQPKVAANLSREVVPPEPHMSCRFDAPCPVAGIWQPWVAPGHPLERAINQTWRQSWLTEGQAFPHPQRDWLLPLLPDEVTWHLMESAAAKLA
jgi:TPR repeat protein